MATEGSWLANLLGTESELVMHSGKDRPGESSLGFGPQLLSLLMKDAARLDFAYGVEAAMVSSGLVAAAQIRRSFQQQQRRGRRSGRVGARRRKAHPHRWQEGVFWTSTLAFGGVFIIRAGRLAITEVLSADARQVAEALSQGSPPLRENIFWAVIVGAACYTLSGAWGFRRVLDHRAISTPLRVAAELLRAGHVCAAGEVAFSLVSPLMAKFSSERADSTQAALWASSTSGQRDAPSSRRAILALLRLLAAGFAGAAVSSVGSASPASRIAAGVSRGHIDEEDAGETLECREDSSAAGGAPDGSVKDSSEVTSSSWLVPSGAIGGVFVAICARRGVLREYLVGDQWFVSRESVHAAVATVFAVVCALQSVSTQTAATCTSGVAAHVPSNFNPLRLLNRYLRLESQASLLGTDTLEGDTGDVAQGERTGSTSYPERSRKTTEHTIGSPTVAASPSPTHTSSTEKLARAGDRKLHLDFAHRDLEEGSVGGKDSPSDEAGDRERIALHARGRGGKPTGEPAACEYQGPIPGVAVAGKETSACVEAANGSGETPLFVAEGTGKGKWWRGMSHAGTSGPACPDWRLPSPASVTAASAARSEKDPTPCRDESIKAVAGGRSTNGQLLVPSSGNPSSGTVLCARDADRMDKSCNIVGPPAPDLVLDGVEGAPVLQCGLKARSPTQANIRGGSASGSGSGSDCGSRLETRTEHVAPEPIGDARVAHHDDWACSEASGSTIAASRIEAGSAGRSRCAAERRGGIVRDRRGAWLGLLEDWALTSIAAAYLLRQIVLPANRHFWLRNAVDAWTSSTRRAWTRGCTSLLLLRFPGGVEGGMVVTALVSAARVRSSVEKSTSTSRLPALVPGTILTVLGAFGGDLLASLLLGRRAVILTDELAWTASLVSWSIVSGRFWVRPGAPHLSLREYLSFVGVHHVVVLFREAFRARMVCATVGAGRDLSEAGARCILPVLVGVLAGCGGVFLPGDRGLSPISSGVPWAIQSALYGAVFYYFAGPPGGGESAQAFLALFFGMVAILQITAASPWTGPKFNPFSPVHRTIYYVLGVHGPPHSQSVAAAPPLASRFLIARERQDVGAPLNVRSVQSPTAITEGQQGLPHSHTEREHRSVGLRTTASEMAASRDGVDSETPRDCSRTPSTSAAAHPHGSASGSVAEDPVGFDAANAADIPLAPGTHACEDHGRGDGRMISSLHPSHGSKSLRDFKDRAPHGGHTASPRNARRRKRRGSALVDDDGRRSCSRGMSGAVMWTVATAAVATLARWIDPPETIAPNSPTSAAVVGVKVMEERSNGDGNAGARETLPSANVLAVDRASGEDDDGGAAPHRDQSDQARSDLSLVDEENAPLPMPLSSAVEEFLAAVRDFSEVSKAWMREVAHEGRRGSNGGAAGGDRSTTSRGRTSGGGVASVIRAAAELWTADSHDAASDPGCQNTADERCESGQVVPSHQLIAPGERLGLGSPTDTARLERSSSSSSEDATHQIHSLLADLPSRLRTGDWRSFGELFVGFVGGGDTVHGSTLYVPDERNEGKGDEDAVDAGAASTDSEHDLGHAGTCAVLGTASTPGVGDALENLATDTLSTLAAASDERGAQVGVREDQVGEGADDSVYAAALSRGDRSPRSVRPAAQAKANAADEHLSLPDASAINNGPEKVDDVIDADRPSVASVDGLGHHEHGNGGAQVPEADAPSASRMTHEAGGEGASTSTTIGRQWPDEHAPGQIETRPATPEDAAVAANPRSGTGESSRSAKMPVSTDERGGSQHPRASASPLPKSPDSALEDGDKRHDDERATAPGGSACATRRDNYDLESTGEEALSNVEDREATFAQASAPTTGWWGRRAERRKVKGPEKALKNEQRIAASDHESPGMQGPELVSLEQNRGQGTQAIKGSDPKVQEISATERSIMPQEEAKGSGFAKKATTILAVAAYYAIWAVMTLAVA